MVICLELGADLRMAQLMPLPLTVSCFSKIQIGFIFLVPAHLSSPGKGPSNGCVCVCCITLTRFLCVLYKGKGKGSPYSVAERRVSELIPVLGSQRAGDVSHKPGGRLPVLSARPAVTFPARRLVPVSLLGEQRHDGCEQFA